MTTDVDTVIERRRLRRRLTVWRGLAITGIVVGLFALGASGDHLSDQFGNKQIARVAVEGTILESRDRLRRSNSSGGFLPAPRISLSQMEPTTLRITFGGPREEVSPRNTHQSGRAFSGQRNTSWRCAVTASCFTRSRSRSTRCAGRWTV